MLEEDIIITNSNLIIHYPGGQRMRRNLDYQGIARRVSFAVDDLTPYDRGIDVSAVVTNKNRVFHFVK